MELKNIKTFIKAAEQGSFSRAASDLGYAQSTISIQIQQLEEELGVPLFLRNGKVITLSAPGAEFLPYAYQLVRDERMAIEHFQNPSEPQGHLRIGIMESICASPYADKLYAFLERYPKISVRFQVATTYQAIELLEKGKLDLIFLLDNPTARPEWTTVSSILEPICFFCSSSHPFAREKEVSLDTLLKERFFFVEEGCNYRHAFEQYLAHKGKSVPCCLEIGHTRFLLDAVERRLGISLLPYCTLKSDLEKGTISLFRLKNYDLNMYIQVICNKNKWISPALKQLIQETASWSSPHPAPN